MNDRELIKTLSNLPASALTKLETEYAGKNDARNLSAVRAALKESSVYQTGSSANGGRLQQRTEYDVVNGVKVRPRIYWDGDNMAWMQHFMTDGARGRFCEIKTDKDGNAKMVTSTQTVKLAADERIQIVKI